MARLTRLCKNQFLAYSNVLLNVNDTQIGVSIFLRRVWSPSVAYTLIDHFVKLQIKTFSFKHLLLTVMLLFIRLVFSINVLL